MLARARSGHRRGLRLVAAMAALHLAACQREPTNHSAGSGQQAPQQPGRLAGELSFPSDYIPGDMRVCAENAQSRRLHCDASMREVGQRRRYELIVPPGRYRVFAETAEMPDYKAYYSQAVVCGLDYECRSHEPILVEVAAGQTRDAINPQDWYAQATPTAAAAPAGAPPAAGEGADGWTGAERELIARWTALNEQCRGLPGGEGQQACAVRDGPVAQALAAADICYGREGQSGYEMVMHRCGPNSLR